MTEYVIGENQTSTSASDQYIGAPKGEGYINTSYYGNLETEQTKQSEAEVADQNLITQLSEKLGIKSTPEGEISTEQTVTDSAPDFSTPEGKKLVEDFKKVTGIDVQEAFQIINNTAKLTQDLEQWRNQVLRDRQVEDLRREWGQEFDTMMPQVVEAFQKLPPDMQKALDNPEGARLLAAQLRQNSRQQMRAGGATSPYVPNSHVRSASAGNSPPVIRMSEMVRWSGQELDARMPDIQRAKRAGTLINDM